MTYVCSAEILSVDLLEDRRTGLDVISNRNLLSCSFQIGEGLLSRLADKGKQRADITSSIGVTLIIDGGDFLCGGVGFSNSDITTSRVCNSLALNSLDIRIIGLFSFNLTLREVFTLRTISVANLDIVFDTIQINTVRIQDHLAVSTEEL